MCGKGSQTQTSTSAPNPQAMQLYQDLLTRAQGVSNTPYQPYGGELVAPVNAQQNLGIAGINNTAGFAMPNIQNALGLANAAAQPISAQQIQNYVNPYTQNVVDATQAQFNNQNQQQLQGVRGNAIAQGALGGNREAIAEAELANQQQLAQAPVLAGLRSQGYQQGVNTALAEQAAMGQGAYSVGNLGVAGQSAGLTGANAQIGAGTLQQQTQQAQNAAAYQQFLNQQAYPFQTAQWLAGIGTGVGSQMGGTSSTTGPAPSLLSQIFGGVAGGAGILGSTGAFGSAGWLAPAFAALKRGGSVREGVVGEVPDSPMPESHETLHAQQEQLRKGHRRAQMFPHGTPELPIPEGMRRVDSSSGVFHYNPNHLSEDDIHAAASGGRENEILDLGPHSKNEIWHRVQKGEHPIAVVERDPSGTEVRAAAGTAHTAPSQLAAMHRTKSPGHTLHIEELHHVLAKRSGVKHRDAGGGVNYQVFGGGFGTPPTPYMGGKGWVPSMGITHGAGAPRPPGLPNQQGGVSGQMKDIGSLANSISTGLRGDNLGIDGLGTQTADPTWTGGDPLVGGLPIGQGGIGSAHRGGVVGYADGGDAIPLDFADRFSGDTSGVVPDFNSRYSGDISPTLPRVPLGDLPGKGFDNSITSTTGVAPRIVPTPDGVQEAPGTAVAPTAGIAPTPLPPERPITGIDATPNRNITPATSTLGYADNMDRIAAAHRQIESSNNYGAIGPKIVHPDGSVDHAYGAYQITGANIPTWTREILGRSMTPTEFLANKEAQDAVYKAKMGQYIGQGGLDYAVHKWLGPGSRDLTTGITQDQYLNRFKTALGVTPTQGEGVVPTEAQLPAKAAVAQYQGDKSSPGVAPSIDWSGNSKLWPALMAAGFGMMASRSPFPGVAIGEGAEQGLHTYEALTQQEANRSLAQRKIDLEAQKLSQEADRWSKDYQLKALPYQGAMTAAEQRKYNDEAAQRAETARHNKAVEDQQRQALEAKMLEPKPYFNSETGSMDYTVRTPEGDIVSLGTGKVLAGPHRGQAVPMPNAQTVPGQQQPNQQQQPGFQQTAFHPDGVWMVNSQQIGGPADYSNGNKLPYIEHGMPVPEPAPVAGYSPDTIKTAAEWYLKTGKQPLISRGASPVAQMQNSYARAVMNYGNALAASRGVSREELTDIWQTAPRVGAFILGQPGQQIVSLGTAMRHLETLKEYEDAWQKAKLGDNQPLNKIQAFVKTQWGSAAASNLNTVAHILGPEIIKAIGVAGAGTDKDRQDAASQFTSGNSEEQVKGAIEATERLLRGQLIGKENQARAAGLSEGRLKKMIGEKEYTALENLDHQGGAAPAAHPPTPPGMMEWMTANPNDPRVPALKQKYGIQ